MISQSTKLISIFILFILLSCNNRGGEPAAPEDSCENAPCENYQSSVDQQISLSLDRTYTNAKDIYVSWSETFGSSEYLLDLAEDDLCLSVKKSLTIAGNNTHLMDLEEGVWHLCMKAKSGPREIAVSSRSLLLVVDRQSPVIEADAQQSLASGERAAIKVSDSTEVSCVWSALDSNLKITEPTTLLTTFESAVSTTYEVNLECKDQADNTSRSTFTFVVGPTVTPPAAIVPLSIKDLLPVPSVNTINLSWTNGGGNTQSYLILRSTASISATPVNGMVYTAGSLLGGVTVVSVGSTASFRDSSLPGNINYFYKIFAYNAANVYATGVETNATVIPLKVLKANLSRTGFLSYPKVEGLRNAGNFTYVCREDAGLAIVNTSNPAAPVQTSLISLGNNSTVGWCSDVKVVGNIAYVADWDKGLILVDITNPAVPVMKGSVQLTNASIVQVEGNFAYVAVEDNSTGGGLAIINVTNPAAPTLTGFTSSGGNAAGVVKIGNFIYLTHRGSGNFTGLKVYDITNPATPSLVRSLSRPSMEEIEVKDGFAYVTVGTSGLEIFDVTTPNNPTSKSLTALPDNGYAISASIADNYAFISDYDTNKMYVLDITNKSAPTSVRSYANNLNAGALYLHVSGANVYMTSETKGVEIIEVFQFQ